ncbi:MAG: hypothetical protein ABIR39_01535 [Nocardioides sp.]|uniref:hypothetical protein n=1 Tax=Nocardioides sp. TaxID=35761 RepID=UPI0032666BB6
MRPTTRAPEDWHGVVEEMSAREGDLSADELDVLARAHWWVGNVPESTRVEELAHHRHVAAGDLAAAAESALRVSEQWGTRGDVALFTAWLGTARRLLAQQPRGRIHGYADFLGAFVDLNFEGDTERAAATACDLRSLAADQHDANLDCFALALTGFAAVVAGDLSGFAALDEAMIPVISGRVDALWGGDVYCSVIHLCEALGDLSRMRAWTDALAQWAAPLSSTFMYAGITRLHQLQLLRAEGEWDRVAAELESQSAALVGAHGWLAGTGYYELGEIHRARGDDEAARAAFARARSFCIDPSRGRRCSSTRTGTPMPRSQPCEAPSRRTVRSGGRGSSRPRPASPSRPEIWRWSPRWRRRPRRPRAGSAPRGSWPAPPTCGRCATSGAGSTATRSAAWTQPRRSTANSTIAMPSPARTRISRPCGAESATYARRPPRPRPRLRSTSGSGRLPTSPGWRPVITPVG